MSNSVALWAAVDRIVEPRHVHMDRDSDLDESWDKGRGWCDVTAYRAATSRHGLIPSLWEQAEDAVNGKGDNDGARGSVPARERSIADWALLEHLAAVKESVRMFAVAYGDPPKPHDQPFYARGEIRHLASLMIQKEPPDQLPLYVYRVEQWGRVLARLLNQTDGPKPCRPRVRCAECGSGMIAVQNPETTDPDDRIMVWPVVITHMLVNGAYRVRGAQCDACGHWWWPGDLAEAYGLEDGTEATRHAETAWNDSRVIRS